MTKVASRGMPEAGSTISGRVSRVTGFSPTLQIKLLCKKRGEEKVPSGNYFYMLCTFLSNKTCNKTTSLEIEQIYGKKRKSRWKSMMRIAKRKKLPHSKPNLGADQSPHGTLYIGDGNIRYDDAGGSGGVG